MIILRSSLEDRNQLLEFLMIARMDIVNNVLTNQLNLEQKFQ